MAEMQTLSAQKRDALGKGPNRRLRAENLVPGVYYNADGENIAVQMQELPLVKLFEKVGRTNVFNLEIEDGGKKSLHPVFIWETQSHPTKNKFTHVDFYGVDLNKEIQIIVPLEFTGTSKGVKIGGKLEVYREKVMLAAKPQDMPRKVTVDITDMEMGHSLRASGLKLPDGVRAVYKNDYVVVAVASPKTTTEESTEEI